MLGFALQFATVPTSESESSAEVFFIGALACALAPNFNVMITARFILGLAVGGASVVVPAYLAEMSPSHIRGRIITRNELMIVTGQFLAFTTNALLGNLFGDLDGVWRWMLALATLPAVALWFGMLYMPESPRWLATIISSLRVMIRPRMWDGDISAR